MSVIIGSMRHEVNSFCLGTVDLEEFRHGYLLFGDEIGKELTGKREGESAFLEVLEKNGLKPAFTMAARDASAGGVVAAKTFDFFKVEFEKRVKEIVATEEVEAVLINFHGAMIAENSDDPEGEITENIRKIVGKDIPIGLSFDAHAKITKRLVENADVMVGYHTIPHIDAYETSYRAAELIVEMIQGKIAPKMAAVSIPTLLAAEAENHTFGAYKEMVDETRNWEKQEGVYSVTYFPGQPWLDYPGNACSFVVAITDSLEKSEEIVKKVADKSWQLKDKMTTPKYDIEEAVKMALAEDGPVVIAELGDAPPAGTIGDGNDLLKALLAAKPKKPCLVTVVDPDAVEEAYKAGVGNTVKTTVGCKLDTRWGTPVEVEGKVLKAQEGNFILTMGDTPGRMGKSAVIQIGEIYLIVCEFTFSHYDPNSYRCMGLEPKEAQIVGVKSTEHFRAFYGELAKDIILADTKGPSMSDFKAFDWKRKSHPFWPVDEFEWKAKEAEILK